MEGSLAQLDIAFQQYKSISNNKNREYSLAGHSLGGRLVQDVLYKLYNSNEGFLGANPYGVFVTVGETMPFIAENRQREIILVNTTKYEFDKVHDIKLWHCSLDFKYPTIILLF